MERPHQGKTCDKEQKWLKKLEMLEETAKFYTRHKLVPEYKPRLTEPMPYWKEFYRQRQALDTATLEKEDVHVFAYEPEDYSSTPNTGKRRYVVTSYAQVWHNIQYLFKHNQPATFYEIIPEGAACKLYFDLEFQKEFNSQLDGVAMVTDLIKLVCSKLDQVFNISCTSKNVIILEASTDSKFSTHLIFNLPRAIFKDNIHVGHFVHQLCDDIRETSNNETESTEETPPAKKAKMDSSSCSSFIVKNSDGKMSLFIDEGVYTKNRNFRLYKCVKLGKGNPLVLSKNSQYVIKMSRGKMMSEDKKLFMDSLITYVKCSSETRILTLEGKSQHRNVNFGDSPHLVPGSSQTPTKNSVEGYGNNHSPFPDLDVFVRNILTKGGIQGDIRQWIYFSESGTMLYEIIKNRWCENIGRAHKSNNIMILVDLRRRTFYQKCHDPDCKKVAFKSPERPLPPDCLPFLDDFEDEELIQALDHAEAEQKKIDDMNTSGVTTETDSSVTDSERKEFDDSTDFGSEHDFGTISEEDILKVYDQLEKEGVEV